MALSTSAGGKNIEYHTGIVLMAVLIKPNEALNEAEKKSLAKVLLHPDAYRSLIPHMNSIRITGKFDLSTREPTLMNKEQADILSIILFNNDNINQLNLNNVTVPKENLKSIARASLGIANITSNQKQLISTMMNVFIEIEKNITQVLLPKLQSIKPLVNLTNEYEHYRRLINNASFEALKPLLLKALLPSQEAMNKEEKDGKELAAAAAAVNNAAPMWNANAPIMPPPPVHNAPPPLLHAAPMGNVNAVMPPLPVRRDPEERIENESEENDPQKPKRK